MKILKASDRKSRIIKRLRKENAELYNYKQGQEIETLVICSENARLKKRESDYLKLERDYYNLLASFKTLES